MLSKLLNEISKSSFEKWILYGIIGLATVSIFPTFSLGWIFLNIVAIYFINIIVLILHELGHIVASVFMGVEVYEIVIGSGQTIIEFQLFGILLKINGIPTGGLTYVLAKSAHFYRVRMFVITLLGPLTNLGLIWLVLQLPRKIVTGNFPGIYIFPGTIFCISNTVLAIGNLRPRRVVIDGIELYSDGSQLMTIPFLSKQDVNGKVSSSWMINGCKLGMRGHSQKAIESFSKAIEYNSGCIQSYQQRGNTYRSMKDEEQASNDYQRAIDHLNHKIDLEPLNASYYYSKAMVYQDWMKIDSSKFQKVAEDLHTAENLCFAYGNTSLLMQIRAEIEKIST